MSGGISLDNKMVENAIKMRNKYWEKADIPKWVDINTVSLDQYYTNEHVARVCYRKVIDFLREDGIEIEDCFFIEPSAGDGSFYKLLPSNSRLGIDICPMFQGIEKKDFLTWEPVFPKNKIVVYIGNPPFGYRGWLALQFVNKCAQNADYIFFVLPMSFQSIGKGSPRKRVNGVSLVRYEVLPTNSYHSIDGTQEKINALWTVWRKGENCIPEEPDVSEYIDLFTVDLRQERRCGIEKMEKASFFLQRTFYDVPPQPVKKFNDVKYVCGYGFLVHKKEEMIKNILARIDWTKYSNLAAHNCHHISMCHIKQALYDGGICNV